MFSPFIKELNDLSIDKINYGRPFQTTVDGYEIKINIVNRNAGRTPEWKQIVLQMTITKITNIIII